MWIQTILATFFLGSFFALIIFEFLYQWVYRFPERTDREVVPCLRDMNLNELKDLLNLAEEGYLRLNLSPEAFRKEQRHRIGLVLEYYGRMTHNAVLLQEWAANELRKSRKTRNGEVNSVSTELNDICVEFRICTFFTKMRLRAWLFRIKALPFISIPFLAEARRIDSFDLVYSYERIKQAAEKLSRTCGSSYQGQLAQGM
jgi:hypothetical protein